MMNLISNMFPLIVTVILIIFLVVFVLPKFKSGWEKEKKDLAKKIAKSIKSKK